MPPLGLFAHNITFGTFPKRQTCPDVVHKDAIKLLLFELFQEPDVKEALVWGEYPPSFSTNLEIGSNYGAMDELEVYISKDRLSVMLDSGDSPTFIARRLAIFASEDVAPDVRIVASFNC